MDELQRQSYLSSLGIDTYVPRWRLPEAPVPVACARPAARAAEPAPVKATAQAPATGDSVAATRTGPAPIAAVLESLTGAKAAPDSTTHAPSLETESPAEPAPAFSLSLWRPEPGLLIVADRASGSGLPTERLVHNLVAALAPGQSAGAETVWHWPPGSGGHLPRTDADARIAVQTWLETELAKRTVHQVWLFGTQAVRYSLSAETDAELWQSVTLAPGTHPAWVLPDLISLLREPLLKRQLWKHLKWPVTH
ncbi:hypothetical protein [Marinimicrobium alkaliphilum]|uniref:hypothetical protein n=1 Tax=Marinimicrobium alkaliphilum TaxID=2202654 RepID=UPI000DB900E5|nr:hypothetical protein [Marinimicrobium alkaliphilum]